MTRRHARQPLEVVSDATGAPQVFRWRCRRYEVRAVLAHWVEAVPWWSERLSLRMDAGESGQRYCWRVEAVCSLGQVGVYDLSAFSSQPFAGWVLDRILD